MKYSILLFPVIIVQLLCSEQRLFAQGVAVQIRQSFETAQKKGKPADFSFTVPDNGEDSFHIGGAAGLMIPLNGIHSLTPQVELNRNTQIEKELFTFGYGVVFNTRVNTNFPVDTNHYFTISGSRHRDYEKDLNSWRARLRWSPFIIPILNPPFDWLLPTTDDWAYIGQKQNFHLSHNISAGFEFQKNQQPENELDNGSITRFFGEYNITLIPFADDFDEKVYLDFNLEQRFELHRSVESELKDAYTYLDFSANYIIAGTMSNSRAVLSATRVYGENPWIGLEKQAFTKVSIKIKI